MNYKDWTISRLKELEQLKESLISIPHRIDTLSAEFDAIRAVRTDATPVMGGTNKREETLIANIAEREELKRNFSIAKRKVKEMETVLSQLSWEDRLILDRFYINRTKDHVNRLSNELGYEQSQIYRMKDDALVKLSKMLYGIAEL